MEKMNDYLYDNNREFDKNDFDMNLPISKVSGQDFIGLLKELSHPWNNETLLEKYKSEGSKEHAKLILNLSVPAYSFDFN